MELRVVGAGLGRTGTHSLKLALETLLGGPCYHMLKVRSHPGHPALWHRAALAASGGAGDMPAWDQILDGYSAAVDWPVAAFWRELAEANPGAVILLSHRPVDQWWRSYSRTIFARLVSTHVPDSSDPLANWTENLLERRFTPGWRDEAQAKAAYLELNDQVRRTADPRRLLDYPVGAGWEPLCRALDLPVPDQPFPHTNTTAEFRRRARLDT